MAKTKKQTRSTSTKSSNNNFFSQVKWGESYTSLFLGVVVVIVALVLVFSFLKDRNSQLSQQTSSTSTKSDQAVQTARPKTYTVKPGDDLWHIAQNIYGSGYNWVDLASANKLDNPGTLYTGTKLIVPDVKQRVVVQDTSVNSNIQQAPVMQQTPDNNKITGANYKIQRGDDLWDIAVRAYGDGYKWIEIARANHLVNPNVIHADNPLVLPR